MQPFVFGLRATIESQRVLQRRGHRDLENLEQPQFQEKLGLACQCHRFLQQQWDHLLIRHHKQCADVESDSHRDEWDQMIRRLQFRDH